jgi:hypothetical protein
MRFLFLNQYFPPDPAPTGVLLHELAECLKADGHHVDFVSARQQYRAGQGKGGRMKRELAALARLAVDAARRPRADVVLSASSPPMLLIVATLVAMRHRARSVHWAMDLYPELAITLGELRGRGLAAALTRFAGWCYRRTDCVVALDEDMAARLRTHGAESVVIRPWVFAPVEERLRAALALERAPEAPWTWIYSGNLGRAHEWETLLAAQAIIERRHSEVRLVFQGGGPQWPAAQARARELGLQRCDWRGYADEAALPTELLRCGACAVTQRPEVKGLLWPSKLGLLLALPRPIVWIGPPDGAIARELRMRPGAGIFASGQAEEVAAWVLQARESAGAFPPGATVDAAAHREQALEGWRQLLAALPVRPER